MKLAKDHVALGDRFAKVGIWTGRSYVVAAHYQPPGMPPHVRLVIEGQRESAGMLMSVSALLDRNFWQRTIG